MSIDDGAAFSVVLTGSGFTDSSGRTVTAVFARNSEGMVAALPLSVTESRVTATFLTGLSAGPSELGVTCSDGTSAVIAGPVINGYAPHAGTATQIISVYGSGFNALTGVQAIMRGSFPATTVMSDTLITVDVTGIFAPDPTGVYLLVLFSNELGAQLLPGTYTVGSPVGLRIDDMFPLTVGNGDTVHMSGLGFRAGGRTDVTTVTGFHSSTAGLTIDDKHTTVVTPGGNRAGDNVSPTVTFSDAAFVTSPFACTFS